MALHSIFMDAILSEAKACTNKSIVLEPFIIGLLSFKKLLKILYNSPQCVQCLLGNGTSFHVLEWVA